MLSRAFAQKKARAALPTTVAVTCDQPSDEPRHYVCSRFVYRGAMESDPLISVTMTPGEARDYARRLLAAAGDLPDDGVVTVALPTKAE